MDQIIRCAQCNTANPITQKYCVQCNALLTGQKSSGKRVFFWDYTNNDNNTQPSVNTGSREERTDLTDEDVVVCRQCHHIQKVVNNVLPMYCETCQSPFQLGIDRVIKKTKAAELQGGGSLSTKPTGNIPVQGNVANQNTTAYNNDATNQNSTATHNDLNMKNDTKRNGVPEMRLVIRSISGHDPGHKPEKISPYGDVLGNRGTVLKEIQLNAEIKVFPNANRWYLKVMSGNVNVDGEYVNDEFRLKNGSVITVENHTIFVIII